MAALAGMTVVVEAAEGSDSLGTAEIAGELGREVGAVPGPVGSRTSAGPNRLLSDGSYVVRSAGDVLDALLGRGVRQVPSEPNPLEMRAKVEALIAEDRVPTDVLHELACTYGPGRASR
jgi:DNA processing protein